MRLTRRIDGDLLFPAFPYVVCKCLEARVALGDDTVGVEERPRDSTTRFGLQAGMGEVMTTGPTRNHITHVSIMVK